jgi:hypothetical protein
MKSSSGLRRRAIYEMGPEIGNVERRIRDYKESLAMAAQADQLKPAGSRAFGPPAGRGARAMQ